jgi:hypothetical protein
MRAQVAARNADVGQIFCPGFALLKNERDCAFPQCRLRTAGESNPLGPVAITLPHPDRGLWRSFEGNRQFAVSFSPGSHRLPAAVLFKPAGPVLAAQLATLTGLNGSFLDVVAEPCCRRARQVAGAVSAPPLWLSLRDWRLAVGSGLAPSIPVFRLVRDCSQRA